MYDIRTAILPFVFIYNNELLMIGIGSRISFYCGGLRCRRGHAGLCLGDPELHADPE